MKKKSRAARRKSTARINKPVNNKAILEMVNENSAEVNLMQNIKIPVQASVELGELVAYDEDLFEKARTQWQFGDWDSLIKIDRNMLQHHPDRAKLALLAATGHIQKGSSHTASQFTQLAQDWGCNKKIISQLLISGVYNTLGRAAIIANQQPRAVRHFESAISIGTPRSDVKLITQARIDNQLDQIGMPRIRSLASNKLVSQYKTVNSVSNTEELIAQALQITPNESSLLIAYAEIAMRQGLYDEAIRRWQHLADVMGEDMLQPYYDRLNEAYLNLKSFPLGTEEEEFLKGDRDKHELLAHIHNKLLPNFYLEIGVQSGKSLAIAKCKSIGIDPMPQLRFTLNNTASVIKSSSDSFFAKQADSLLTQAPDLVFIDGMHLFEYVLRDFINVERYAGISTLVVIDDIYPGHPAQAQRKRKTMAWTGDVWKLLEILKIYRPDLFIQTLDAYPTGLLMITGLNPVNHIFDQKYDEIVERYIGINEVPDEYIERKEAWYAKKTGQEKDLLLNELYAICKIK